MNPDPNRPISSPVPAQRKVFDVVRPGRAQPNSTSKPVIVGHRPVVSDPSVTMNGIGARPMMNPHRKISITSSGDTSAPTVTPGIAPVSPAAHEAPAPAKTHHAVTIAPLTPTPPVAAPAPAAAVPATPPAPAPPVMPEAPKPSVMPWAMPSTKPAPLASIPETQSAAPAIPIDIAATDSAPDDDLLAAMPAPSIEEPEAQPQVSQQVGPREFPWKWIVPIAIVVILAVVIVDILLDADFISWGIPHTHFLQ
jgi:hypothetical protein